MIEVDIQFLASTAVVLTASITILTVVVIPLVRRVKKINDGWDDFMRDWKGEDASLGRDSAPGVMERLNNIDGEFKKNSGSTLKDAVARIESKLEEVDQRLQKGDERMSRIEDKLEK